MRVKCLIRHFKQLLRGSRCIGAAVLPINRTKQLPKKNLDAHSSTDTSTDHSLFNHGELTPKAPIDKPLVLENSPSVELVAKSADHSAKLAATGQFSSPPPPREQEKEVSLTAIIEEPELFKPTFFSDD